MKLQTHIKIPSLDPKINYSNKILMLGSCFSDNIGRKLEDYKFKVLSNPFGTLYNPASIANTLENVLYQKTYTEQDIQEGKHYKFSFDFHSDLAGNNVSDLLDIWNTSIQKTYRYLKDAKYLFITFGTAWIYELDGSVVANCHQEPASRFERRRLSVSEIEKQWKGLIQSIKEINPSIHIVFTVSPVRHWKDGAIENQVSKSTLLLAIHQLIEEDESLVCFPAYEIMMDELRDYRFYKEDMLHPNALALDYIWEKFMESSLDEKTFPVMIEIEKVKKQVNHKVRFEGCDTHKAHLESCQQKLNKLTEKYPFLDFSDEFQAIKQ